MSQPAKQPDPDLVIPQTQKRPVVTQYEVNAMRELSDALQERRIDALALYRPMPVQQQFHDCQAQQIVAFGGNRAGKSLAVFVEDARAVRGCDPYGRYPKKDGRLVIVGQNWKHVALVVYPMLFKAGAFRIVRDPKTNEWRACNPETDKGLPTKPAPPLIPPRDIKGMSFVNKKERYLSTVELVNGWIINIFSSDGEVPQGFAADLVHIDEDVEREEWVSEMQARLSDRKGRLIWSAMPHAKNDALAALLDRAVALEEEAVVNPPVKRFQFKMLDNPHIDDEEKKNRIEDWRAQGEDILNMRLSGEVGLSLLMYPTFQIGVHGMKHEELPQGQVPLDWCRYMAVDPGYQVCGVLFAVIPPDEKFVLIEGELYIRNCTSELFGEKVAAYLDGKPQCRAFIMDAHGGALSDIVSGLNVKVQYGRALRDRGIESEVTGTDFILGCDDLEVRANCVRLALGIRPNGTTWLRVLRGATDNLCRTMKRFKRTVQSGIVTDKPNTKGDVHLAQCLEYLLAYQGLKYHRPKGVVKAAKNPLRDYLRAKKKRYKPATTGVFLGPQTAA